MHGWPQRGDARRAKHAWLARVASVGLLLLAACPVDDRRLRDREEEGALRGAPTGTGGSMNDVRGTGGNGSSVSASADAGVVSMSGGSSADARNASGVSGADGAGPGQGGAGSAEGGGLAPLPGVAALTATLSRIDFAQQELSTASEDVAWTISNLGAEPLGPLGPSSSNPAEFRLANGCPSVLEAGRSCNIGVSFHPQGVGLRSATLTVSVGSSAALSLDAQGTGAFRLTVVRAGAGSGTLTSSLPGIDCGSQCSAVFSEPVQLQARTQNGENSFFAGWSSVDADAQCSGPARDCLVDRAQALTATFAAQDNNLIFVSSQHYPANLGGLARYDAECNALASAAGINDAAGSAYIAAMSDAGDAANPLGNIFERLGSARGWVRMDGFPVGDDSASVFQLAPYYAPMFTEQGAVSVDAAWSGLDIDFDDLDDGEDCGGWTQARADSFGTIGSAGELRWWAVDLVVADCSQSFAIFCMGKRKQQPLGNIVRYQGKRLWQTTTRYTPGTTTPDQKCQSERPAGVANGVAFVAYTDRPASAVLEPAATYVLSDGRLVGSGAQLQELNMLVGPWLLADGSVAPLFPEAVWTGGTTQLRVPASAELNCLDWTSAAPSRSGLAGSSGSIGQGSWSATTRSCDTELFLYCVEPPGSP
jgi:hypothetical protein